MTLTIVDAEPTHLVAAQAMPAQVLMRNAYGGCAVPAPRQLA